MEADPDGLGVLDYGRFENAGRRLLRQDLRDEEEARKACAGSANGEEAWEALNARGVIPDHWVSSGRRKYVREPWFPSAEAASSGELVESPTYVEAAITLASDVPGVAMAEELAEECHRRRFARRGDGDLLGFVWRVLPAGSGLWTATSAAVSAARNDAAACLWSYLTAKGYAPSEVERSVVTASYGNNPNRTTGTTTPHAQADAAVSAVGLGIDAVVKPAGEPGGAYAFGYNLTEAPRYVPLPKHAAHCALALAEAHVMFSAARGFVARGPLAHEASAGRAIDRSDDWSDPALAIVELGYLLMTWHRSGGGTWAVLAARTADDDAAPARLIARRVAPRVR